MPGGGGGNSKTVTTQELSPEQKKLIGMVIPAAEDYLKNPPKLWQGSTIPKLNAQQQAAQKSLLAAGKTVGNVGAYGVGQLAGTGSSASKLAQSGLGSILADYNQGNKTRDMFTSGKLLDVNSNPALKGAITAATRPIMQNLTRSALPQVRSDFIGGNSFGSSRQGIAEGLAMGGAADAMKDATTGVVNNAYNQGLGATLSALNAQTGAASAGVGQGYYAGMNALQQLPGMAQLAYAPAQTQSAVGQQNFGLQQARLGEQKQQYTTQQMMPFLQAQDVASLAMGLGGGSAVTNAQTPQNWGSTLGGLGMFAMALPGLMAMSDRRLKSDIEFQGVDTNGVRWYEFTIGGVRKLGVMADEVDPSIVVNIGGYYAVDYSQL